MAQVWYQGAPWTLHVCLFQRSKAKLPTKKLCCSLMFKDRCSFDCTDQSKLVLSICLLHLTTAICLPHTTCISALYLDDKQISHIFS